MIYDYKCEKCEKVTESVRRVDDRDEPERCDCGGMARRIFSYRGHIGLGTFKAGYYPTFGQAFTNESQLKEALAKHKGETGSELVELGNEKPKVKKQRKKVDWDEAGRELRYRLKHG